MFDKKEKPWYPNVTRTSEGSISHLGGGASVLGDLHSFVNSTIIATAGELGSQVKSLLASTKETVDRDYHIFKAKVDPSESDGTQIYCIGTIHIPAGSGSTTGVQSVDVLAGLVGLSEDNQSKPILHLEADEELRASCMTDMSSDKPIYFTAILKDYEAEE